MTEWATEFSLVPTNDLFIDTSYQRPEITHHVQAIANAFDPVIFGSLVVSARRPSRSGRVQHAIIDGQQRQAAARILGLSALPCSVAHGLSIAEEADKFVKMQRQRLNVRPIHRYQAEIVALHPWAVDVNRIVTARGIEVSESSGRDAPPDALAAIVALEWLWNRFGSEIVEWTLDTIVAAWPGIRARFRGEIIRAIGQFAALDEPDQDLLISTLIHDEIKVPNKLIERSGDLRKGRGMGGGSQVYTVEVLRFDYAKRQKEARRRASRAASMSN